MRTWNFPIERRLNAFFEGESYLMTVVAAAVECYLVASLQLQGKKVEQYLASKPDVGAV